MQKQHHKLVENQSDDNAKLLLKQINGKEVSSCLTVLPFEEHVFDLNKDTFWDADALWYNRNIFNLPSKCPCGKNVDVNCAMNCKKRDFVSARHNNNREFEANLIKKKFVEMLK